MSSKEFVPVLQVWAPPAKMHSHQITFPLSGSHTESSKLEKTMLVPFCTVLGNLPYPYLCATSPKGQHDSTQNNEDLTMLTTT